MEASAISVKRQSMEGLLAMGIIGIALWLMGIVGVTVMYKSSFWQSELCMYYVLNTLAMLVVALSLSYLIGMFITNSNILSGVANLVSLAMCFLCGVFVPMDVIKDYRPVVEDEWLAQIGIFESDEELYVLSVLTVPSDLTKMTINLKAPIVINISTRLGCQIIVNNEEYPIRYSVYDCFNKK